MATIKQAPPHSFKMGLEKSNLQLFEITTSSHVIPFVNNRWMHGLTKEEKELVEAHYGHSFDNPAHNDFWGSIEFEIDHTVQGVDTKNPEDILKVAVLKAMSYLAPTLEDAQNPMANYLFVLTDQEEEEEMKATLYERTDSAIANLLEIKKSKKYMLAFAKYLLPTSLGMSEDVNKAYTKVREFLDLKLVTQTNTTKKAALSQFERALDIDKGVLYTTVDFRDAVKKNILRLNAENQFYNVTSGTVYGKNEEECISYLMNPKNQDELGTGTKTDKNYSIRYQLKVK